jgi:integrase
MASITNDPGGRKRILFHDQHGKRRPVRLGIATMKQAEALRVKIETIVQDLTLGRPHDDEVTRWLRDLNPTLRGKLERAGLVKGTGRAAVTLGAFLDEFFTHLSVKQSTVTGYGHAKRCLLAYFGAGKFLRDIEPADGDRWRQFLKATEKLSEATISKRVVVARMVFKKALKWKLIAENPLADVKAGSQKNKARMYFVTEVEAQKVLEACPDAEWRLLFALSRYGGLRCPSEHLLLRWSDVDWAGSRILVHSPKTEHNEGGDCRFVPMFPKLRRYLLEAFEAAEEGAEHVITRYRNPSSNLRTQLCRIIKRAGLKPWPKLFHNLRSTRQTELTSCHPIQAVCQWLGNSEDVAKDHYLQVTETDMVKATQHDPSDGSEAAQNAAQQPAAGACGEAQGVPASSMKAAKTDALLVGAMECGDVQDQGVASVGLEPTRFRGGGF